MDYKKLTTIIPILSVCVMLVWGLIANDWSKCWIAVVIGGVLTAICRPIRRNNVITIKRNNGRLVVIPFADFRIMIAFCRVERGLSEKKRSHQCAT